MSNHEPPFGAGRGSRDSFNVPGDEAQKILESVSRKDSLLPSPRRGDLQRVEKPAKGPSRFFLVGHPH
jgi:hypothetical protein